MIPTSNELYKKQNAKLLPATVKKGIISAINITNRSVDVILVKNQQTVVRNIPIASNLNILAIHQGDKCKLDIFDETNPNDMVVAYTYGGSTANSIKSGTVFVTTSGVTVPHGLGATPDLISIIKTGNPYTTTSVYIGDVFYNIPTIIDVYQYQVADASNMYLKSVNGTISIEWCVGSL